MGIKRRSVIIMAIILLGFICLVVAGYWFNWGWTGLDPYIPPTNISNFQRGKTLWDWLQLLFIPSVLTLGAVWIAARQNHDREIASEQHEHDNRITEDNQREVALQSYIDKISDLLLHEKLREAQPGDEIRNIARVRTLTVLPKLDPFRKRMVIRFLQESALIDKGQSIIDLRYSNLRNVDLHSAHLYGVELREVDLREADLREANLREAELCEAKLSGANLEGTDLSGANLSGAIVTDEQLAKAEFLQGATMPDGSVHP